MKRNLTAALPELLEKTKAPWVFTGSEAAGGFIVEREDGSGFFSNCNFSEVHLISLAPDLAKTVVEQRAEIRRLQKRIAALTKIADALEAPTQ